MSDARKEKELEYLHANWEAMAVANAPHYILMGKNDWDLDEFYGTGVAQIAEVMQWLKSKGFIFNAGLALDFGCGMGRLTNGLSSYFEKVVGIDISETMIAKANAWSKKPANVTFVCGNDPFSLFGENRFDFIFTRIVLQHIAPDVSLEYIGRFIDMLVPGGIISFDLPEVAYCEEEAIRNHALETQQKTGNFGPLMYRVPKEDVAKTIEAKGGKILHKEETLNLTGGSFLSGVYWITK